MKNFTRERSVADRDEVYCKYRTGEGEQSHRVKPQKIRRAHVNRDVDDKNVVDGKHSKIILSRHALNENARDYKMIPNELIVNVNSWLIEEAECVEVLLNKFDDTVLKGRLVLSAWFVKRQIVENKMEVLRRERVYLSSYSSEHIVDKEMWYQRHVERICKDLDSFKYERKKFEKIEK